MPVDFARREREAAAFLDRWPWSRGGVLVGGYVTAAYGAPRYSEDLDLVVPVSALRRLHAWLAGEGFEPKAVPADLAQNYAGRTARWAREGLTVDLLPGAVRDREAKVDIPERWISRDPKAMRLVLVSASTRTTIPVVRPEAFWALKLQAGRLQDLADLFAIRGESVDASQVRDLFETLRRPSLERKLARVLASVDETKTYEDVLSRLSLGSPKASASRVTWEAFRRQVRSAMPEPH